MAKRTISYTLDDVADGVIYEAMKWNYGQVEDPVDSGDYRDMTNDECDARQLAGHKQGINDMITRYEEAEHKEKRAPTTVVNIT